MHCRGYAVAQNLLQQGPVNLKLSQGEAVDRAFPAELDQTQNGAGTLGDGSGNGGPFHALAQKPHKKPVQENVEQG